MLSHGLWARKFGSDPAIVGRTIQLNREDFTVVGVMGADFRMMWMTPQLWIPLTLKAADLTPEARRNRNLIVFSRLAPGIALTQAMTEAKRLASRAATDYPSIEGRWGGSGRTVKGFCDCVVLRFAVVFRPFPGSPRPAVLFESNESGIDGALVEIQSVIRNLQEPVGNAVGKFCRDWRSQFSRSSSVDQV